MFATAPSKQFQRLATRALLVVFILQLMIMRHVLAFRSSNVFRRQLLSRGGIESRPVSFLLATSGRNDDVDNTSVATSSIRTNQDLVERRLDNQRQKREARKKSLQDRHDRNLQLKRLLHTQAGSDGDEGDQAFQVPSLYAVKIWVAEDFREELRLTGREKRGRVFLEKGGPGVQTFKGLKAEMHAFFRALRKDTYLLEARLPVVSGEGAILPPSEDTNSNNTAMSWPIENDDDVLKTFKAADNLFQDKSTNLTRPGIVISVLKNPNAPVLPPPPPYLVDMLDPAESETMTMLSFYSFPPSGIADPEEFAILLRKKWKAFNALGRVYVADEGVNAQMSIPTNVLSNFMACCRSLPPLEYMENGINIDPKPLTMEEFAVAGVPMQGKETPPFRNLHVRVRSQVVADGLDKSLDWQSAGYDMPPLEWHAKLREAKTKRERPDASKNQDDEADAVDLPILLDCRNTYETDVGIFDGAEPLDTENFRDSWDVLKERLADTPKDAPIMTYCTGGIRCVKVGAYLTQEMGFTNVSRLAGGIIAYDRTVSEETPEDESMFKGTNFVFDGRLGRTITDDTLAVCLTCGGQTSSVSNCRNDNCHKRIVQCESCRTDFMGTCSDACRYRVVNGSMEPRRQSLRSKIGNTLDGDADSIDISQSIKSYNSIEEYSLEHSSAAPSMLEEMEENTRTFFPTGAHMVSGDAQGRLLTQLASMSREGRILELGTFSGYATACFWEGAKNAGEAIGTTEPGDKNSGPYVLTMERDARAFNLAHAQLEVFCRSGMDDGAVEVMAKLRANPEQLPELEEEKISLPPLGDVAGCDMWRVNDALAAMEQLSAGKGGEHQPAPFDMVFIDADKTRLLDYVEACLNSDHLLKKGGTILVDNVLWKGLVLEAGNGSFTSVADSENSGKDELRKNRRARKLATQMHRFNDAIVQDARVDVQLFPIRDGLSIIRKK